MDDDDLFDDTLLTDPGAAGNPGAAQAVLRGPQVLEHVDGVDVLAEPARDGGRDAPGTAPAAGGGAAPPRGLRARIRASRFGSVAVLLVTALVIAGGVWVVDGRRTDAATASGTTVVTLPGTTTVPAPKVGTPAQDFTLTTTDGRTVSLEQFRGKPVWIVFGASWCAACQAEVPEIEAAYEKYAPKGLVVLGVNINEGQDAVRGYASRVGLTYRVGADDQSAIADAYRVSAIPAHFFVDPDGVLREVRQGGLSTDGASASVERVLAP